MKLSSQVKPYYRTETFLFPTIVDVILVETTFLHTATRDYTTLHNSLSRVHTATGDYSTQYVVTGTYCYWRLQYTTQYTVIGTYCHWRLQYTTQYTVTGMYCYWRLHNTLSRIHTATGDYNTLHNTLSLVHAATGDYSTLHSTLSLVLCCLDTRPRGLTFSWWGRYGLCHRHKPTKLAHSFLLCSCVCFCLYGPFNSISFHKFSRQLFAFSLRSSGLNSALLILSNMYLFIKVSLSPDLILCG